MTKNYWLVKSEPESYSWAMLVKDGRIGEASGHQFWRAQKQ